MKRPMIIAPVSVVLILALRTLQPMLANPLEAVRAAAEERGPWQEGRLVLLEGGYESAFVGMTAWGTFQVQDGPREGHRVRVKVVRPTPLQDWHLEEYTVQPSEAPDKPSESTEGG